jgi:twitching motility protein PilT
MHIDQILKVMVEKGASDLHLMVASKPVMRINGVLIPQDNFPVLTHEDTSSLLEQMASNILRTAFRNDLELDFAYSISGLARFRVNVLQQRGSVSIAVRLVPFVIPSIDELGLPEICKELMLKPRGLILITGSAGSGKSTTLAALINYLNETEPRNIITIEDPIEYIFHNNKCLIHQRDLGDDTKSFDTALIHALRHDPDVMVIGELRDLPTIATAIRAAETGQLVIGTMHTNSSPQTLDRLIDIFPSGQQRQIRQQLAQVINAVISQRLVPRIGGGRVAVCEVLICNSVIGRYIREEKIHELSSFMELAGEGTQTIDQALANLVTEKVVTLEDALMRCTQPEALKRIIDDRKKKLVYQIDRDLKWSNPVSLKSN